MQACSVSLAVMAPLLGFIFDNAMPLRPGTNRTSRNPIEPTENGSERIHVVIFGSFWTKEDFVGGRYSLEPQPAVAKPGVFEARWRARAAQAAILQVLRARRPRSLGPLCSPQPRAPSCLFFSARARQRQAPRAGSGGKGGGGVRNKKGKDAPRSAVRRRLGARILGVPSCWTVRSCALCEPMSHRLAERSKPSPSSTDWPAPTRRFKDGKGLPSARNSPWR